MLNFKHIVIPVDFSDFSKKMLTTCEAWLDGADGQTFHFVYVWEPPAFGFEGDPIAELRTRLEDFTAEFKPSGKFEKSFAVLTGHPGNAICAYALEHDGELIVMATRGRSGLEHLLIGSTAENVVRHAHCPVMTVRLR